MGDRHHVRAILVCALVLASSVGWRGHAQTKARTEAPVPAAAERSTLYLATIAAAEAGLRLHETDRVKHWLAEAPSELRGWEWRYLYALSDRSEATFAAPGGAIADLSVSPDGRLWRPPPRTGRRRCWMRGAGRRSVR